MIKKISIFLLIIMTLGVMSCDSDVSFTEPQPKDVKTSKGFKRKFRGEYISVSDSTLFEISRNGIIQKRHVELEADSFFSVKKKFASLNYDTNGEQIKITANADSTHFIIDYESVVFGAEEEQVLKYDQGIYYLNYPTNDNYWDVQVLYFSESGNLRWKNLQFEKSQVDRLKEFTEITEVKDEEGEVTRYLISPTPDELYHLVNSDLVSVQEEFFRKK